MDVETYLARLGYFKPVKPDAETLQGLHLAHMQNISFGNLDIGLKRPILLTEEALWNKIVVQKREGFCYELNGLFAWLLKQIGFEVTYLNARVYNHQGKPGIDFDHLALFVQIPVQAKLWLADVGFGDSFDLPLNFEVGSEQIQGLRSYRLEQTSSGYITWQKNYDGAWERQYFFDLEPRKFPDDYETACSYHQTSPKSSFTRRSIISRATPEGRVSLEDELLILTKNGQRSVKPINKDEYQVLLKEYFGFTL